MTPDPGHASPYPGSERGADPRPWWHRDLEERVKTIEAATVITDVALLAQRLEALERETRLLRTSVILAAPAIAGVAALVARFT